MLCYLVALLCISLYHLLTIRLETLPPLTSVGDSGVLLGWLNEHLQSCPHSLKPKWTSWEGATSMPMGDQLPETEEALGQGPLVLNPGRPRAPTLAGHSGAVSSCGQQVSISHKDTKMGISLYS